MRLLQNHKKKKQLNRRDDIIRRLDSLLVEWKPAYEESSTKEEDIQKFNKIIVSLKSSRAWLQSIDYKDSYKVITLIEKINEKLDVIESQSRKIAGDNVVYRASEELFNLVVQWSKL